MSRLPPCILHEDEHLLVVNKPAGLNTHSPAPYAGEGIFDWLRNREPRWANLAIIHRLDKATSGVIVFTKTRLANQSLTQQFGGRSVSKTYLLLTALKPRETEFTVQSGIRRAGEKYVEAAMGEPAETRFRYLRTEGRYHLIAAEPLTGRTHQIRVHAAANGFPILGDTLYGGESFARVCLHAEEIRFAHPATNEDVQFRAEADFFSDPALALRSALIEPELTNAFRLIHGAGDGEPDLYIEKWADYLLFQGEQPVDPLIWKSSSRIPPEAKSIYFKLLQKSVVKTSAEEAQPQMLHGDPADDQFVVRENGVNFEISFQQGYSVGLFLDQRDNRRRLLTNYVGPDFTLFENGAKGREILNTFAYTCGFSLCAAVAGARATSLDLSKKYLEWGKRNFALNGLDSAQHDFIYGDLFDWAPRLAKKGRRFDLIVLDPPTFSRSKGGVFQAERDYGKLVATMLPLLSPSGILFASTNAHRLTPEDFLAQIRSAAGSALRTILQEHYIPQPPDFPITREEPAYLKTVWMRIA